MDSPSMPEPLPSAPDFDPQFTHSVSTIDVSEKMVEHEKPKATWSLTTKVKAINQQLLASGLKRRKLGVQWDNLTVQAPGVDSAIKDNSLSQFNLLGHIRKARQNTPVKTILNNSHGCVKPGEMLLVLGRPGAGCTSLLKILANRRLGYSIEGNVHFGSMDHFEAAQYRGQIMMNTEEEIFFPTLTVGDTMDFATRLKVPSHQPQGAENTEAYRKEMKSFLLESMSISHTANTKVGNEYVRGVSGGERKRVSIIECLASRGSTFCWDNSTRGLDASTALDWAKALRSMTDEFGLTTICTLYQAGNGIYDLFDKVLVLDEGEQVFYGPMKEARPFMEKLGFVCRDGSNVADFLTGVTMPAEREIRPGFEHKFPRNGKAIRSHYESSPVHSNAVKEYDYPTTTLAKDRTESFKQAIAEEQHQSLPKDSALTTSLPGQISACIIRQYQIIQGDWATFIKQVSTLVQALVAGSLFYNASSDSPGLFIKSGACFFAVLYNGILMPMSEVTDSFFGRPVLIKHKHFAFFHPAAFCIAQIVADIPTIIFQITHFTLVLYFMVGLKLSAAAFFTHWVIVFSATMCLTAMFRAIGAAFRSFDSASKISGFLTTALVVYTGYLIQKPAMHPWLGWIFWINPMAYAFEAILATEFKNSIIDCTDSNLIPTGPGYSNSNHQSCAGVGGAVQGEISLTGDQYLNSLSYSTSHIWRNFGILWAWWILFVAATVILTTRWQDSSDSGSSLLIPHEKRKHFVSHADEESQSMQHQEKRSAEEMDANTNPDGRDEISSGNAELTPSTSVFTWKNLTYTVKTPTGDRVLLDNIQGWVKPGMLGALMGSSGAGKTTLLDVLAQRKTDGTINGSILVDGQPLPLSFQRSAGYCEQLDVHEPYATVREAFEFSALLRQPGHIPKKQKLAYVDTIIDLLELHDLADTLIGTVGAGLSVEQRKRVTIGVELVSKPTILIFLDEPTSGLDGQSAFNTVRFLRKLADIGQAILVTIHQPSSQLFSQFDTLLLLAKGGKTVYFGDIGDNGQTIKRYFGRYGAVCPPRANPAEYMIDVVSGNVCYGQDWHQIWLESPEHNHTVKELDHLLEEAQARPAVVQSDDNEFAMSLWGQIKIVTHRMNVALYRNTEYVNNKFILHIISALFNGFSFWMIGDKFADLQMRLFTIFNFIFVAPGVVNQLQPLFIERRDIYDTREKKSRMYSWKAFVIALIVSELPYLCICAVLYFVCWYYTVGFPSDSHKAGASFFLVLLYEFIYTSLGQMIAAFAPNPTFAALANPVILGTIVAFCGMLVPYAEITPFWRYWLYYLNPFTYVTGGLLTFNIFDAKVECAVDEFAIFDPPSGQTCAQYLADYLEGIGSRANLVNPTATEACRVCQYQSGSDYLYSLNLQEYSSGWRNVGITIIFIISSYAAVFAMMKLRTKASKKAE